QGDGQAECQNPKTNDAGVSDEHGKRRRQHSNASRRENNFAILKTRTVGERGGVFGLHCPSLDSSFLFVRKLYQASCLRLVPSLECNDAGPPSETHYKPKSYRRRLQPSAPPPAAAANRPPRPRSLQKKPPLSASSRMTRRAISAYPGGLPRRDSRASRCQLSHR